jgi:ABC-type lipoprotein export system ATPase subunit
MNISIKYCNNIDEGHVEIVENKLNIKYAINGTGKSTISKAISIYLKDKVNGREEIKKLKPFKFLNIDENNPEIIGIDHLTNIKVFDEEYVNKYIFLPDELVQGSFDIFIRDEEYENGLKEINELTNVIQSMFAENKDIDELINDLTELSNSFGRPVKNGIHGSSNISKAFKGGNKVLNVPTEIEEYKDFIQSENNFKWLKWIIDGRVYLDLTDNCPYCITNISKKKNKITKISEIYEPKVIEYLNKIVAVFTRLDKYFSDDTRNTVHGFISNIEGYTNDQVHFLLEVKEQIDRLNKKFNDSKRLGFQSLKDVDKVIEVLKDQRIDINLYGHLKSEDTIQKVNIVNKSIDTLLEKAGILQGKIAIQKKHIEKIIQENKIEINSFLKNAGFDYHVDLIEDSKKQYSLKLLHKDVTDTLADVKDHLSFGERNAFSIVLFMYDALKSKSDIIILDDPISSFDKNKKYAIIDMLFRRTKSLKNKTVLMLTHDFEPILDMVFHHRDKFDIPQASFLVNCHGNLSEKKIEKSNMKTFIDVCLENVKSTVNDVTKLVYLRRYYEIINEKGNAYQLISNLLHKRDVPLWLKDESREMTKEEISAAVEEIKNYMANFDYNILLSKTKDDEYMKKLYHESFCNYEKLHIYRVLYDEKTDKIESSVITKFINQAFHMENDYIYQLNPCEYQLVPQFVIDECDNQLAPM